MEVAEEKIPESEKWEEVELASLGQRVGNFLLDTAFISILSAMVELGLGFTGYSALFKDANPYSFGFAALPRPLIAERLLVMFIYYTLQEWTMGRTIGKLITDTQAINDDGNDLTLFRAIIRTMCRFIPFEFLSFLIPRPEGIKGWHDSLSRTLVITLKKKEVLSTKKTWQS